MDYSYDQSHAIVLYLNYINFHVPFNKRYFEALGYYKFFPNSKFMASEKIQVDLTGERGGDR